MVKYFNVLFGKLCVVFVMYGLLVLIEYLFGDMMFD